VPLAGLILTLLGAGLGAAGVQTPPPLPVERPRSPVVVVVGCASESAEPHIWTLSRASTRTESDRPGLTTTDKTQLAGRPLGRDSYQLIGIADFVDAATAARIGIRGKLLSPARMNTTGMLATGHKVAVKGLYIDGSPPRINLTSVADLGECR
jgi:hypothetical protein